MLELLVRKIEIDAHLNKIRELRSLPTVLFGCGCYANELKEFLSTHDIDVVDSFVDDDYLLRVSGNSDVKSLEDVCRKHKELHIIVAFCRDPFAAANRLQAQRRNAIKDVHVLDVRFWKRFLSMTRDQLERRVDTLRAVYDSLEDENSRKTWIAYINAKLTYDPAFLRPFRCSRQYFPEDLEDFSPSEKDVFIDCGAFTGDTLAEFIALTQGRGCAAYYALEPDSANADEIHKFVKTNRLTFVQIIQKGVWNRAATLKFSSSNGSRSMVSESGEEEIHVERIDNLGLVPSFIKMDIEGSELRALEGGWRTISAWKPNLAIALYHNPDDLCDIPLFVKRLCPDYRLYVRLHSCLSEELVLYATART